MNSFIEVFGGTALGFVVSLVIQYVICWWHALPLSAVDNLGIIAIFTVASLIRGYGWRRVCEAMHIRSPMSPALLAIAAERRRQTEVEGWTPEHDDEHSDGSLAVAAAAYAIGGDFVTARDPESDSDFLINGRMIWPWTLDFWKLQERRRNLIRAGALIVADLDRLNRQRKARRNA